MNNLKSRIISSKLNHLSDGTQKTYIDSLITLPLNEYLLNNHTYDIPPLNDNLIKHKWCIYNLPPCFDIDISHLTVIIMDHINTEFNLINGNLKVCYLIYLDRIKDEQIKRINDMDQLRRKYILRKHNQYM